MNERVLVNEQLCRWIVSSVVITLLLALCAAPVWAGTASGSGGGNGGQEFKQIFDLLTGWISGYLGRTIALAAFIIGIGMGAFKQNGLIALGGILFAVFIMTVPKIIDTMLTAVI